MKKKSLNVLDNPQMYMKTIINNIDLANILPLLNLRSREEKILKFTFCEWKSVDEIAEILELSTAIVHKHRKMGIRRMNHRITNGINNFKNAESLFQKLNAEIEDLKLKNKIQSSIIKSIEINLNDCKLSSRTMNSLRKAGLETLYDVLSYSKTQLLRIRKLGPGTVEELENLVQSKGLTFNLRASKFEFDSYVAESLDEEELLMRKLLQTSVQEFDLSVRALNTLDAADIETIIDLVKYDRSTLLKFRNSGKKTLIELEDFLESKGLSSDMDLSKYKLDQ